jgi:hypothetical protein
MKQFSEFATLAAASGGSVSLGEVNACQQYR